MLRSAFVSLVIVLGVIPSADAQPAAGGRVAPPPFVSPEVDTDRTLTLRCFAPNATQVTASGELDGTPHPMTKGPDGVWTVTLGPLQPDIYTYAFDVDGVVALDPKNANTKYGYGRFGPVSVVQVPGDGPQFYDVKPGPHGQVRIQPYLSKTLGVSRTVWIYTPPGYEGGRDFPVLYLLHGAGDIESGWTMIGRANNILDNLIAEARHWKNFASLKRRRSYSAAARSRFGESLCSNPSKLDCPSSQPRFISIRPAIRMRTNSMDTTTAVISAFAVELREAPPPATFCSTAYCGRSAHQTRRWRDRRRSTGWRGRARRRRRRSPG